MNGMITILTGHDEKIGWLNTEKGKALLYNDGADAFRNKETIIRSFATYVQLASVEGNTLRAPEGLHDDRAISYVLCLQGIKRGKGGFTPSAEKSENSITSKPPKDIFGSGSLPVENEREDLDNMSVLEKLDVMGW